MPAVVPGIYQGLLPAVLGSAAWYRAGIGQTDAGSGALSAWADQSGNGRNLLQGTGANRPAIQADGSVLFDGIDDYMQTAAFVQGQPFTVYLVFSMNTAGTGVIFDRLTGSPATSALVYNNSATSLEMFCTASGPQSAIVTNTPLVLTAAFNGASSLLQSNSGTAGTGDPGPTGLDGLTLGARNDLAVFGAIRVWEMIIRNGADSEATRLQFQQYLKNRYDI